MLITCRQPPTVASGVADRAGDRVLPRRGRIAQQLQQVGDGELLPQVRHPDRQRVERASLAFGAGELDDLDLAVEGGEVGEAVVGLGVEVDDHAARPGGVVGDQLRRHRLARPEGAGQEHGAGPRLSRRRGGVVAHDAPRPAVVWPRSVAAAVADDGGGGRDHGAELLGGELLAIIRDAAAVRPGEVVEEQPLLKAPGAEELDVAIGGAQRLHAALELVTRPAPSASEMVA